MNILQQAARRLERLEALDKVARPLAATVGRAVQPRVVRNLLSGTYLGHPLHPVLTDLPIGAIERAIVHDPGDQILVLAKSIDLSWKTTRAILMLDSGVNAAEYVDRYKKLRLETARSPIQFYRLRERATKTPPR